MPKMYKPGCMPKHFDNPQAGLDQGYWRSYSEMAAHCAKQRDGVLPDIPASELPPEPEPTPPKDVSLSREEVLAYANANGLDTTIHHTKLRKQVEDLLAGGADTLVSNDKPAPPID